MWVFAEANKAIEAPTQLALTRGVHKDQSKQTYIVETPASIADESVSAVSGQYQRPVSRNIEALDVQLWRPMRNANSTTGAVYCPSAL